MMDIILNGAGKRQWPDRGFSVQHDSHGREKTTIWKPQMQLQMSCIKGDIGPSWAGMDAKAPNLSS
ncbi:hypothetical protein ABTO92_19105, partial [Acinetobacter baumannii]